MRSEEVTFRGHGGDLLRGRLELPRGSPDCYALFAHCFTCGKDSIAATRISRLLADEGIATLRFDFTGLGNSDGDFANTNFSSNVDDLRSAIDYLCEEYESPRLLLGHSLGGAAVISLARTSALDFAVVSLCAPYRASHVGHLLSSSRAEISEKGVAEVNLGGRKFRIGKTFLDDIDADVDVEERRLHKPLLVMHAPGDKIVGIENAEQIFRSALHPKSFISLDSADHLLLRRSDAEYAARIISAWSARYVRSGAATSPSPVKDGVALGSGEVEVFESLRSPLEQTIISGRHSLTSDEPESLGGLDRGPTPFDYVLSALGSCTTMTLRLYARRRSLNLRCASVRLSFVAEPVSGKRVLRRVIRLEGDISAADRERLLEIAEKCPVHRAYSAGFIVETSLVS